MIKIMLPLAASLAIATPAFAEDFAGPFLGAGVTLDNVQSSNPEGTGISGLGGTIFAGYDLPLGANTFAGVEANFDLSSADDDIAPNSKADMGWGVSGRLGYKLNDNTGLYGRVGYARGRLNTVGAPKVWLDGVKYGLGLQTGLTEALSLRAEVSQINYEDDIINNQAQLSLSYGF